MEDKLKILILGASGFIGQNLKRYFKNKYKVVATYYKNKPVFEKNIKYIKVNLLDQIAVNKIFKNVDIVINAAAVTSGAKDIINKPQIHFTDNVIINANTIRAAHENFVKHYIFLSCSVMYQNSKIKMSEKKLNLNFPINKNYFGAAWNKIFAEKSCEFYSNFERCKYSAIRHSNIYGKHDKFDLNKSHFFGATINKVFNPKFKDVKFWGKGIEKRDFLYIDDLIKGIEKIIKHQKKNFDIINLSYGKSFPIIDIAKKILKFSNKKKKIIHDFSKPNINIDICLSNNYALKNYKWKPNIKIDNGIKKTINWYLKYKKYKN